MKVKCTRLLNDAGQDVEFSPWLTLGRVYHVLSIEFYPNERRNYGIITSERTGEWPVMGCFSAECFEIVSMIVPPNWSLKIINNGIIIVAPRAWLESNFWEDFADHEPSSYPVFEREREIILKEEPL